MIKISYPCQFLLVNERPCRQINANACEMNYDYDPSVRVDVYKGQITIETPITEGLMGPQTCPMSFLQFLNLSLEWICLQVGRTLTKAAVEAFETQVTFSGQHKSKT